MVMKGCSLASCISLAYYWLQKSVQIIFYCSAADLNHTLLFTKQAKLWLLQPIYTITHELTFNNERNMAF